MAVGITYRGQSALVTGASSGLGEEFARALAARGMSVLLTALPSEARRLQSLAAELTDRYGVRIETVALDLAEPNAARRLQASADDLDFEPDILVNCAGLGLVGSFHELSLDRQVETVRVNIETVVALTRLYAERMVARGHGGIINIASTSALTPVPYFAVYGASKAFVLSFGEALWCELRRHGVRVTTVCPGPIGDTAFPGEGRRSELSGGLSWLRHPPASDPGAGRQSDTQSIG